MKKMMFLAVLAFVAVSCCKNCNKTEECACCEDSTKVCCADSCCGEHKCCHEAEHKCCHEAEAEHKCCHEAEAAE